MKYSRHDPLGWIDDELESLEAEDCAGQVRGRARGRSRRGWRMKPAVLTGR